MECNKDEALRVAEMAERKLAIQDYTAAKKLLLKAQQLYPTLENLSRMLAVVEVHTLAQGKASGTGIDWYQLLQVDSTADDSIIKKNFRRLALMLHPDKNKVPGTEAAFKLVAEAWGVLSDKTNRCIYDSKRACSRKNGTVISKQGQSQAASQTSSCNTGAFWTACLHCNMQYQYLQKYLNYTVKCPQCSNDYIAVNKFSDDFTYKVAQRTQAFKSSQAENVHVANNLPRAGTAPFAAHGIPNAAAPGRENMPKVNISLNGNKWQKAFGEVKGTSWFERQKSSRNTETNEDKVGNKRKEKEEKMKGTPKTQQNIESFLKKRTKQEDDSAADAAAVEDPFNLKRTKKATLSEQQSDEEHKKADTLDSDGQRWQHGVAMDSDIKGSSRTGRDANFDGAAGDDSVALRRSKRCGKPDTHAIGKSSNDSTSVHQNPGHPNGGEEHKFSIPDPDFHNFDKDRTKKSFRTGQIWAVYDDVNAMPSYYCLIEKILATASFGVHMKWLEALPYSKNAYGKIADQSPACGLFECAKKINTQRAINLFSHVMRVDSTSQDHVKIYPRCGEVWALFKDWDFETFRSSTLDDARNWKYEVFEIISDYCEEMGVTVALLVKLDGYRTVFTRQRKAGLQWFPSTELSRFSHMIPSWKIIGKGLVDGSWDLDPASLPLDLMHGSS